MSAVLPPGAGVAARGVARDETRRPVLSSSPTPAERLAASRTRLRAALMQIAHPPPKPSILDGLGIGDFGNQIFGRLKELPGAALLIETVEHWWAEHPLHTAGVVAAEASRKLLAPIVRKNPSALMLGSVVVGALFAISRPWRWLLRPALFVGLVPQLASRALKRMPIESWLQMFATLTKGPKAGPAPTAAEPASNLPTKP